MISLQAEVDAIVVEANEQPLLSPIPPDFFEKNGKQQGE
jgi:hypothetical protein